MPNAATPYSSTTPESLDLVLDCTEVSRLFLSWLACLRGAEETGIADDECDRRADRACRIERELFTADPQNPRDVAIKAYAAICLIDGCVDPLGRLLRSATADPWATRTLAEIARQWPEIRAAVATSAA